MSSRKEYSALEKVQGQRKKKKHGLPVIFALLLAGAVAAFLLIPGESSGKDDALRLLDFNAVSKGVHVLGIDISGMTNEQALTATSGIPESLLDVITVKIDVNGKAFEYSAYDIGIDTDYEDVISAALSYGRKGTFEERMKALNNTPADFKVNVRARKDSIKEALEPLKQQMDKPAADAAFVFMPHGYAPDETAYKPGKAKPVRIAQSDKPNALRYKYYRTSKYIKNYIPKDADISRFVYMPEHDGVSVDIEALAARITSAAAEGDYSVEAPVTILKPTIHIDSVKYYTQLISSWTSSYESHDNADRNYNVAKLSGIINGVVIEPGETWSINEEAGARTYEKGWKGAPGILKGAYVTEPGGGVCQVSSTLYNAALRSGLMIEEASRHSIISNYIPVGLDATISSGNKDLKIKNPYDTPVFIVSYVNAKDKNLTVEIYGPPVMDASLGQVVLDFSSKVTERTEMPETEKHYNAAQTPDEKPIEPGKSKLFVKPRRGTTVQVYIHYISLDGKELEVKKYYVAKYPKITGHEYINDAPPE